MKAILSIFLMLQIVFSSMSLNISMHYCLGELADVGVFEEAEVCAFEEFLSSEPKVDSCEIKNKSCCGHERHEITGQDHNTPLKEKQPQNFFTDIQLVTLRKDAKNCSNFTSTSNKLEKPPLIEPPIFLQVQSFRL